MEFNGEAILPEHTHEGQVGFVLEGKIELNIDGIKRTYFPRGPLLYPGRSEAFREDFYRVCRHYIF
jgi:hypothetical protein